MGVRIVGAEGVIGEVDNEGFVVDLRAADKTLTNLIERGLFILEERIDFTLEHRFDATNEVSQDLGPRWGIHIPDDLLARIQRSNPPFEIFQPCTLQRLHARKGL